MKIKCSFLYISVISLCVSTANAIYCFQCNSGLNAGCDDLRTNDTDSKYYQECPENHKEFPSFCRKSYYKIIDDDSSVRINRECGWLVLKDNTTRCHESDTEFKYEINCQCFLDGCNGASSLFSQQTFLLFALASILATRGIANRF